MIKQIYTLEHRGTDPAGSGEYGAPRSKLVDGKKVEYTHKGVDYKCQPGSPVLSPVTGVITRLGYPYANDLTWRYIEITEKYMATRYRIFYIVPNGALSVGDQVKKDDIIGVAQDITKRYPDSNMTPHIHYEIKDQSGKYQNPEPENEKEQEK